MLESVPGVGALVGTGLVSLGLMVGSVLLLLLFVTRLPHDYFSEAVPACARASPRHPILALAARVGRNVLGLVLLVAGIAMLVLPGQGLLTILLGLMLLEFPGKRRLERSLVSRPRVLDALNRLRRAVKRPPLERPRHDAGAP